MNWVQKLFTIKRDRGEKKVIWSGTISSDGPKQQGPVTVLALRTDFDKKEFEEGCQNGEIDFNVFRPMEINLNYPISPYARGYIETYKYLVSNRVNEVLDFIDTNKDNKNTAKLLEEKHKLKSGVGAELIIGWAARDKCMIANIFFKQDSYIHPATNA